MAVLLGLAGTQIIPYLERSREAKDLQIINSYCTAAVSAYAFHAELFAQQEEDDVGRDKCYTVYGIYFYYDELDRFEEPDATIVTEIVELTGYGSKDKLLRAMKSMKGNTIDDLYITFNWVDRTVTVQAKDKDEKDVFEPVISHI